jgi:hypothetical protein
MIILMDIGCWMLLVDLQTVVLKLWAAAHLDAVRAIPKIEKLQDFAKKFSVFQI